MPDPRCGRAINNGNSATLKLKLHDFREGDAHVIALAGSFDGSTMEEVERELDRAEGTNAQVIVLDLRVIDFIEADRLKVVVMTGPRPPTSGTRG
jgi:anti-anti-sigma regulatory factor